MTADHRDFDAAAADAADAPDPVSCTFTLGGRTWRCRPGSDVPWNLLQRVFITNGNDEVFIEVERFFRGTLLPEDVEPFMAMLDDPDSALTEAKVTPVVDYVCDKVLGTPTKPSAGSGMSPRRRSSRARSSSPDTARIASVG